MEALFTIHFFVCVGFGEIISIHLPTYFAGILSMFKFICLPYFMHVWIITDISFDSLVYIGRTSDIKTLHPWASYKIRKIAGCACAGNTGNVFPATDFKGNRQLAIPACITARVWRTCLDACRDRWPAVAGKTFPAFPAHAEPATIVCIW